MNVSRMGMLVLMILIVCPASGESLKKAIDKKCDEIRKNPHQDNRACKVDKRRLRAFQPNYVIGENGTEGERYNIHYSFRYLFTPPDCLSQRPDSAVLKCLRRYERRWSFFFTYTGEFDFFYRLRPSDPVINRISNPAFHMRKHFNKRAGGIKFSWLNLSIEHRSNGQVTSADEVIDDPGSPNNGAVRAQIEYLNGNAAYFDELSRGADYLMLEALFSVGLSNVNFCNVNIDCIQMWISAKPLYPSSEANITWGPLANQGINFADYDRYRIIVSDIFKLKLKWLPSMEFSAEWLVGDRKGETDSFNLAVFFPFELGTIRLPVFVRYHKGPLATLSNYTKHTESIGIGFKLR